MKSQKNHSLLGDNQATKRRGIPKIMAGFIPGKV
jgi:hypothetical protein